MDELLVLHIGAGNHLLKQNEKYHALIKDALIQNNDSLKCISRSSSILEKSPLTNCGYGSSLNFNGEVSNEASFLQNVGGKITKYGSMHDIHSPCPISETIDIFNKIDLMYLEQKFDKIGITRPLILRHSIKSFVYQKLGLENEEESNLVLDNQNKKYEIYKQGFIDIPKEEVQDTIGLIHQVGDITSVAASSGGNFLKLPSRIGCAGIIGSGLGIKSNNELEVSCMCSGNGEDIILLNLSNLLINQLLQDPETNIHEFLIAESERVPLNIVINGKPKLYVGVILLVNHKKDNYKQLIYYHTTESFYFGYRFKDKIKVIQSRNKGNYALGERILRV